MKTNAIVFDFAGATLTTIGSLPLTTIHIPKKEFLSFGEPLLFPSSNEPEQREVTKRVLRENLLYADSDMFNILQSLVPQKNREKRLKVTDAVNWLNAQNPMGYNLTMSHPFYEYKLKRFLAFTAFGFMRRDMSLGNFYQSYTIMLWDSKPICLVVYDIEGFMQFLLTHTIIKFTPVVVQYKGEAIDVFELVLSFHLPLKKLSTKP